MFLNQTANESLTSLETKPLPVYKGASKVTNSELLHHETDARIYAFSRRSDLEGVTVWYRILEKDIPRVCCDHPVFKNDTADVLEKMKNILRVYAFFHCEVGYVQVSKCFISSLFNFIYVLFLLNYNIYIYIYIYGAFLNIFAELTWKLFH